MSKNKSRHLWIMLVVVVVFIASCLPQQVGPHVSPSAQTPTAPAMTGSLTFEATATPSLIPTATFTPTAKASSSPLQVNQLSELARWGKGAITAIEYSPDGKRLGITTALGVYIYDSEKLQQLDFIPVESAWLAAAFSPEWSLLALGSGATVTILRLTDKTEVLHLETDQGKISRLLFSPDGQMLAGLVQPPGEEVYTRILDLWGIVDGKLLGTWEAGAMPNLAFTPDSRTLYAWNPVRMDGIHRWQIPSGSALPILKGYPDHLLVSPDGRFIVTTGPSDETDILIQNVSDGTLVRKLTWKHSFFADQIRFSPDGTRLVACSYDGFVQVWNITEGSLLQSFTASSASSGLFMAISSNGEEIALPSEDGLVFYSLSNGQILRRLREHFEAIVQAAISPQGDRVAALIENIDPEKISLAVWTLPGGHLTYFLSKVGALNLAWSPEGNRLALAGYDGKIHILRSADGATLQTWPGHNEQVQSVTWSPDGTLIASSAMRSVKVWDVQDGKLINALSVSPSGWVESLRFSPDGRELAASTGERIEMWDINNGVQPVKEFPASAFDISGIEFAPDASFLVLAEQTQLLLYHLNENKPFLTLPSIDAKVTSISISPDSSFMASGLTDGSVQIWKVTEGKLLRSLKIATMGISSLNFSDDRKTLMVASRDGTIHIWGALK